MKEVMAVTKALADRNRTRILIFLRAGELCVCQIIEMLALAPSTVSKHLNILHQAALIESRKEGRWIYYRLPDKPSACVKAALLWLTSSLAADPHALQDARRRKAVLRIDKETLCCRYKRPRRKGASRHE